MILLIVKIRQVFRAMAPAPKRCIQIITMCGNSNYYHREKRPFIFLPNVFFECAILDVFWYFLEIHRYYTQMLIPNVFFSSCLFSICLEEAW